MSADSTSREENADASIGRSCTRHLNQYRENSVHVIFLFNNYASEPFFSDVMSYYNSKRKKYPVFGESWLRCYPPHKVYTKGNESRSTDNVLFKGSSLA